MLAVPPWGYFAACALWPDAGQCTARQERRLTAGMAEACCAGAALKHRLHGLLDQTQTPETRADLLKSRVEISEIGDVEGIVRLAGALL